MKSAVMFSGFLLGFAVLAGCGGEDSGSPSAKFPEPAQAYQCEDGFRFVIQPAGDLVSLFTPDGEMRKLTRQDSDVGERYADSNMIFWRQEDEAMLQTGGLVRSQCTLRTPEAPYEFQASGFEPGWVLGIDHHQTMDFVGDYGELEVTTPAPEPEFQPKIGAVTYEAESEGNVLRVVIRDKVCYEASGDPAPTTVTVTLNDREYEGCGTARPPMPEDAAAD